MGEAVETAIRISSINRERSGQSTPDDFVIKFTPPLRLPEDMDHRVGLSQLSMTYSWHNITRSYGNDLIKYTSDGGSTWKDIRFIPGSYSYDDLDKYIEGVIGKGKTDGISISFVRSTYKVVIKLAPGFQLDLRNSKFGDLIGFDEKIVSATEVGSRLPNITNSIDVIYLNCSIIDDSLVDGIASDTLAVIPTDNLRRSFPFTVQPMNWLLESVSTHLIKSIRFYIRDSVNRPIDLNGIDWHLELVLRSTPRARPGAIP